MGSANKVPICFAGYDAFDIAWVILVPGPTGLAITSRRSYNPIEPIDRLELISASRSRLLRNLRCKVRSMTRLICFAARHDSPHHAGHLVCHGYARHARWLPGEQREEARIRSLGLMPRPANQRGRPITRSFLRYRSPILVMCPRRSFPPLEFCEGVSPSQAANSRPSGTDLDRQPSCQRCGTDRTNARYGR